MLSLMYFIVNNQEKLQTNSSMDSINQGIWQDAVKSLGL